MLSKVLGDLFQEGSTSEPCPPTQGDVARGIRFLLLFCIDGFSVNLPSRIIMLVKSCRLCSWSMLSE